MVYVLPVNDDGIRLKKKLDLRFINVGMKYFIHEACKRIERETDRNRVKERQGNGAANHK